MRQIRWNSGPYQPESGLISVGRATSHFDTANKPEAKIIIPEGALKLLRTVVDVVDYYSPARGPQAELDSMRYQAGRTKPHPPIDPQQLRRAVEEAVKHYPTSRCALKDITNVHYQANIIGGINPCSGPGFPLGHLFKENKHLLENQAAFRYIIDMAVWRIKKIAELGPDRIRHMLEADPTWAVKMQLADPYRTFGKDEATKLSKVVVKRWRLIFSMSIVDQLVERLLFTPQDRKEISMWPFIPSKSGMGLGTDQVALLLRYAEERGITVGCDAEGWDWNVANDLIVADAEARILLNTAKDPLWESAVRGVTVLHAHRLLMLSDGRIFRREHIGGQASGRKITSSGNGRARFIIDVLAAQHFGYQPASMTQGDDDCTRIPEWVSLEEYETFVRGIAGIQLTDLQRSSTELHFCSQVMKRGPAGEALCIPERPLKQFVTFVKHRKDPDRDQAARSIEENFRDLPSKEVWFDALRQVRAE